MCAGVYQRKKMAAASFGCDHSGNEGIDGREKQLIVEVKCQVSSNEVQRLRYLT